MTFNIQTVQDIPAVRRRSTSKYDPIADAARQADGTIMVDFGDEEGKAEQARVTLKRKNPDMTFERRGNALYVTAAAPAPKASKSKS